MKKPDPEVVVYIASPYTLGDVGANVKKSMQTAHELMDRGIMPICPLLSHFLHILRARDYIEWMNHSFEMVRRSDAILRLPGESKGADAEVALATRLGIPVYYNIIGLETDIINKVLEPAIFSDEEE